MLRNFADLTGYSLSATDGEIGVVREIYFDDRSSRVRYLVVSPGAWISGREVLIAPRSVLDIHDESGLIRVSLTKVQVRSSPPVDSEKPISRQYEQDFHDHYGWIPYWADFGNLPGVMITPTLIPPPPSPAPKAKAASAAPAAAQADMRLLSGDEVCGYEIHAQDGEIGHIEDFVIDDETWHIRYLVIVTRNWFPGKRVLLAPAWIEEISSEAREVFVNVPRSTIKAAPDYDSTEPITREFEEKLHDHYGHKAYWHAVSELHRRLETD